MKTKELLGKVVVVTRMRKVPGCCAMCSYYDNMGNRPGRGNDGACTANGGYYSTESIAVSKQRLPNCPLAKVGD